VNGSSGNQRFVEPIADRSPFLKSQSLIHWWDGNKKAGANQLFYLH
jgi:hypothetical protein